MKIGLSHEEVERARTRMVKEVCWYTKGLNSHLSSKGFVHFITKDPMVEDYENGTAYYFDEDEKVFGRCDFISNDSNLRAIELRDRFKQEIKKEGLS